MRLRKGEHATVNGYTLTYLGSSTERSSQKATISARVRVEHGDRDLGVYAPAISTYPNSTEGIGTPSVRTGVKEDVYLTLVSSPNGRRAHHARRAREPDDRVAVDRRRRDGARHGARARAAPAATDATGAA